MRAAEKIKIALGFAAVLLLCARPMNAYADNDKIAALEDQINKKKEVPMSTACAFPSMAGVAATTPAARTNAASGPANQPFHFFFMASPPLRTKHCFAARSIL